MNDSVHIQTSELNDLTDLPDLSLSDLCIAYHRDAHHYKHRSDVVGPQWHLHLISVLGQHGTYRATTAAAKDAY